MRFARDNSLSIFFLAIFLASRVRRIGASSPA